MKTFIFIVLCVNLGYIVLGWRHTTTGGEHMALLKVYDVTKKTPNDLVSSQNIADVSDAIIIADDLVKRDPAYLYKVFDSSMNVVYMR